MAFLIKNTSGRLGGAMVDGQWLSIPSGKSVVCNTEPSSLSYYVKLFALPDGTVKESNSVKSSKGAKNTKSVSNSGGLTLDSSDGIDSSDSAILV